MEKFFQKHKYTILYIPIILFLLSLSSGIIYAILKIFKVIETGLYDSTENSLLFIGIITLALSIPGFLRIYNPSIFEE